MEPCLSWRYSYCERSVRLITLAYMCTQQTTSTFMQVHVHTHCVAYVGQYKKLSQQNEESLHTFQTVEYIIRICISAVSVICTIHCNCHSKSIDKGVYVCTWHTRHSTLSSSPSPFGTCSPLVFDTSPPPFDCVNIILSLTIIYWCFLTCLDGTLQLFSFSLRLLLVLHSFLLSSSFFFQ